MSGIGGKLKSMAMDMVPGDAGRKVSTAMSDGHTTSGIDSAMQAHADKMHPTSDRLPKPVQKPAGGYSLKLPSDDQ